MPLLSTFSTWKMSTEVVRWLKKNKIMSTWLLNSPFLIMFYKQRPFLKTGWDISNFSWSCLLCLFFYLNVFSFSFVPSNMSFHSSGILSKPPKLENWRSGRLQTWRLCIRFSIFTYFSTLNEAQRRICMVACFFDSY